MAYCIRNENPKIVNAYISGHVKDPQAEAYSIESSGQNLYVIPEKTPKEYGWN